MGTMTDAKIGGLALIAGSVAVIIRGLLTPGGPLIDTVSRFDLIAVSEALVANAILTHTMSLLFAVAMILILYGLVVIWKIAPAEDAMGAVLRIGVSMLAFSMFFLAATAGLDHATVHVVQHGVGAERTETQAQDLALTLQSVKFGIRYIAGAVGALGFVLLSLGVSARSPAGFNWVAAQVAFVCSILVLILLLITEHFHDINIDLMYWVGSLLGAVIFIWVIILGVGLYKGVIELSSEPSR